MAELQALCAEEGFPRFAAKQLCDWLYKKRVDNIDAMTNLSKVQRASLDEIACIGREYPVRCQVSKDGTKKYLFPIRNSEFGTQNYVEAVYIPEDDRATLCVSCQVGCKMSCRFCVTGQQGFHGNLSAGDILNQLFSIPEFENLTNIVFMGMGEPLDNWENVRKALEIITAPWGMAWSPKRVTVSTIGQMQHLPDFLAQSQCHLAISIHSPFEEERLRLMPVQKAYPIADVLELLRQQDWSHQRNLTFEYIIFKGLNDDARHAHALIKLLAGLECKVNLIRFHAIPDVELQTSDPAQMERFRDLLNEHGLTATIRASRGEDIYAACGMLSSTKRGDTQSHTE